MYWEVINISNIEKAYFSIDRENEYYEGYHNPKKLWNGWAMPCFEKKIVDIMKEKHNQRGDNMEYDKENDRYIYTYFDGGTDIFESIRLDTPDGKKKLYQIGAGYWVWDYYSLEEAKKLYKDAKIISLNKESSIIKKAYFNIDGQREYYEGYHNPKELWNGWAMPYFEKKIANVIKENMTKYGAKMEYDEENDYYTNIFPDEDEETEDKQIFHSITLDTLDGEKKLYQIGSAYWIWTEYTLEKIKGNDSEIISLNKDSDVVKTKYDSLDMEY